MYVAEGVSTSSSFQWAAAGQNILDARLHFFKKMFANIFLHVVY